MLYKQGDRHKTVIEHVRVHRPSCVAQQGDCGCSLALVAQPARYYINDKEVTEQEYVEVQADYHRLRTLGRAP